MGENGLEVSIAGSMEKEEVVVLVLVVGGCMSAG